MAYLVSAPLFLLFTSIVHPYLTLAGIIPASLEFLPLMMTSVWCSLGLWVSWIRLNIGLWSGRGGVELKVE